jgi:uncharacterized membrane protein YagU involved in acid resistance
MSTLIAGAVAGLLATGPMTAVMFALFRLLPRRQRYPLPPRLLTGNLLRRLGLRRNSSREQVRALTWVLHFAYGMGAGALFAPLYRLLRLPAFLLGALYGLFIWVGSYKGWLPAANLLPDADEQPDERNALMITAHLVWGTITGMVAAYLLDEVPR